MLREVIETVNCREQAAAVLGFLEKLNPLTVYLAEPVSQGWEVSRLGFVAVNIVVVWGHHYSR